MKIQIKIFLVYFIFLISGSVFLKAQTALTPTATFLGSHNMERIGYWLQYAGDVNGDGFDDFLIGNNHSGWAGWDSGAAYLILGRANADWGLNFNIENVDAYFIARKLDGAGYGLGGGGDVNGDGFDDILIGAPAGRKEAGPRPGNAFLVFGKAAADWGSGFALWEGADVNFEGETGWDVLGIGCAIVGDVNGDGFDDLLMGGCDNDRGAEDAGTAYLVLGRSSNWPHKMNVRNADAIFYSQTYHDAAGYVVNSPGDVNGDGYADMLIGAYKKPGRIYLIFGKAEADWGTMSLNDADVIFTEKNSGDMGGSTLDGGDVNGDGIDDILIGASNRHTFGYEAGKVYIFFGRKNWNQNYSLAHSDASYVGEHAYDHVGLTKSLSSGFDLDSDGCDEILIAGQHNDNGGFDAGMAYVIKGKTSGWKNDVNLNEADYYFTGEDTMSYTGMGFNFAGDVNGDGHPDMVLSAPLNRNRYKQSGKVYLFITESGESSISGKILNEVNGNPVSGVKVDFDNGTQVSTFTNGKGEYSFPDLPKGASEIIPGKSAGEDVNQNSISAYDAALVARDAVGISTLTSQQRSLADVDTDGDVSLRDAAFILRFAVGIRSDTGSKAGEWIFSPEKRTYVNRTTNLSNQDFTALLMGDVDGNWVQPGEVRGNSSEFTETGLIRDVDIMNKKLVKVNVIADAEMNILSADMHLKYNKDIIKLKNIKKTDLTADFRMAYNDKDADGVKIALFCTTNRRIKDGTALFEITFEILDSSKNNAQVIVEACRIDGLKNADLDIRIADGVNYTIRELWLSQNFPNPFNSETVIHFNSGEGGEIEIKIYDTLGKKIKTLVSGFQNRGTAKVVWDGSNDNGRQVCSGVYFCRLRLKSQTKIIKLIKLD